LHLENKWIFQINESEPFNTYIQILHRVTNIFVCVSYLSSVLQLLALIFFGFFLIFFRIFFIEV